MSNGHADETKESNMDHKMVDARTGQEIMPEEEGVWTVLYQKIMCDEDGKVTLYFFVDQEA